MKCAAASWSAERSSALGTGPADYFVLGKLPTAIHFFPMTVGDIPWPHAPPHRLAVAGTYFVTASTQLKVHHFRGAQRLSVLHRGLLKMAAEFDWHLEAWAVFSNHYHFVGHSPGGLAGAESLSEMLGRLHSKSAAWINRLDNSPERQVWHNFRETRLSFQKSYLARLNYVHQNPVKHGPCLSPTSTPGVRLGGSSERPPSQK
jgi:putative transposase